MAFLSLVSILCVSECRWIEVILTGALTKKRKYFLKKADFLKTLITLLATLHRDPV